MHESSSSSLIVSPFRHPWGWTALAPVACAVHCAVMPIAAFAAPSVVSGGGVEWGLLGVTLLFAAVALTFGVRTHGSMAPFVPVALGLGIWTASLYFFNHLPAVELTTMGASILVAFGLLWNSRMSCVSRTSGCPGCQDVLAHEESDEIAVAVESRVRSI